MSVSWVSTSISNFLRLRFEAMARPVLAAAARQQNEDGNHDTKWKNAAFEYLPTKPKEDLPHGVPMKQHFPVPPLEIQIDFAKALFVQENDHTEHAPNATGWVVFYD